MSKTTKARSTARPIFYDRKVIRRGWGAQISVGKILPKHWCYVRLRVLKKTKKYVDVRIERLLENHDAAYLTKTNKKGEQNT